MVNGATYWYKLELIDTQSIAELYEPPVSAIAGTSRTATPTATRTATVFGAPTSTEAPVSGLTRTPTATTTRRVRRSDRHAYFKQSLPVRLRRIGFPATHPTPCGCAASRCGAIRQRNTDGDAGDTGQRNSDADPIP